jgi:Family of unknown function (DUF6283)
MHAKITRRRRAGPDHQVVTVVVSGDDAKPYRRAPCADCPWRKDAVGIFPAQAFRISAHTAYDMSPETFACHQSGKTRPATCAGFLLRAEHNLAVRLAILKGKIARDVTDGGVELHEDYRAMAVANGVDPDDPVLAPCR